MWRWSTETLNLTLKLTYIHKFWVATKDQHVVLGSFVWMFFTINWMDFFQRWFCKIFLNEVLSRNRGTTGFSIRNNEQGKTCKIFHFIIYCLYLSFCLWLLFHTVVFLLTCRWFNLVFIYSSLIFECRINLLYQDNSDRDQWQLLGDGVM